MCATHPILRALLLVALAIAPVMAHDRPNNEYWLTLGDELFGSHFQYVRGFAFSPPHNLAETTNLEVKVDFVPKLTIPCFNITIPFINKVIFDLVEPCGSITMPESGMTFNTTFGSYHVAGMDAINHRLDLLDHAFAKWTGWLMGGMVILHMLYSVVKPSKRQAIIKQFNEMKAGALARGQGDQKASDEEKEQDKKDKLDINSDKFICPGNIYRLVTVLGPAEVGYAQWGSYCLKAGVCAYMQLYLPINIVKHCFKMWHFNGMKSPLYFAMSGAGFFMQFTALASVCTLFAAKCSQVIEVDALACHHLLSHDPPAADSKPAPAGSIVTPLLEAGDGNGVAVALLEAGKGNGVSAASAGGAAEGVAEALASKLNPPQWLLDWNEKVWCVVNMVVTCVSSVSLMLAMYMKVATFTGDIINIAIVTVSLYFVFDLSGKIMDSDPDLNMSYRREVLKQTEKTDEDPRYPKLMASVTVGFLNATIPLGLLMIVAVSWRQALHSDGTPLGPGQKPIMIGSDPFHQ